MPCRHSRNKWTLQDRQDTIHRTGHSLLNKRTAYWRTQCLTQKEEHSVGHRKVMRQDSGSQSGTHNDAQDRTDWEHNVSQRGHRRMVSRWGHDTGSCTMCGKIVELSQSEDSKHSQQTGLRQRFYISAWYAGKIIAGHTQAIENNATENHAGYTYVDKLLRQDRQARHIITYTLLSFRDRTLRKTSCKNTS